MQKAQGRAYLQDHPAQLSRKQQLLPLANERVDDEVFLHIYTPFSFATYPPVYYSPLLPVCMQSTPNLELRSVTCLDLMLARVSIGLNPEFSARAIGTESRASEKARMAYCSSPGDLVTVSLLGWCKGMQGSLPYLLLRPRRVNKLSPLRLRRTRLGCRERGCARHTVRREGIVLLRR